MYMYNMHSIKNYKFIKDFKNLNQEIWTWKNK